MEKYFLKKVKAQVSDQRVYHETQYVLNKKNINNKNQNQEIKKNSELSVSRNCYASTSELRTLIRAEVEQQERLEAMGYRSPTWRLLRALMIVLLLFLQKQNLTIPAFGSTAARRVGGASLLPQCR